MKKRQVSPSDVRRIQGKVRLGGLDAPKSFTETDCTTIAANVNLCGTDDITGDLVPETIYFYYIGDCCVIHDWEYFDADPEEELRKKADRRFRNNLIREMRKAMRASKFYRAIKKLFRRRIKTYYKAVRSFGGGAFWDPKND